MEKCYNRLEKVPVDLIPMPLRGPDAYLNHLADLGRTPRLGLDG